ncbi:hypothetical protein DFW101_1071 [Solidesulfovibrio carbinoliphilus subsp. oakridgensis]|uniref:Uncharacterized protein n=1 Tax=Solidesulfovibrio carbinoliphilus subsp. oakridgensis TaxID=694327 RepID=G7Q666_9BACT|nr:hypothetical protein [Solidesulfovibrio carbinoliphilus]EHJ47082.1 hypothetical protein DFW101_1071 [Solidesulfovibrio carbinoliphilus subsp. oakridgensis]
MSVKSKVVGVSPEEERESARRNGLKPVYLPKDSRFPYRFFRASDGGRNATSEEVTFQLDLLREGLERHGLTFAEPGDPDGFLVKWKDGNLQTEAVDEVAETVMEAIPGAEGLKAEAQV